MNYTGGVFALGRQWLLQFLGPKGGPAQQWCCDSVRALRPALEQHAVAKSSLRHLILVEAWTEYL